MIAKSRSIRLNGEVDEVTERKAHDESVRIAHLTMLQGVITRMGANSFTLKTLSATFVSAAVAVIATAEKPSPYYAVAAIIPIITFWLMDAHYLRFERAYRALYRHVSKGGDVESYSLEAAPFMQGTTSVLRVAISRSVCVFYVSILFSLAVVAFMILYGV